MGESASLVLAVPYTFRDGLDGCEPFRGCTNSALWCCASDGGGRLLDIATTDHCIAGSRLHAQKGYRRRLERQAVAAAVRRCHSFGLLVAMDLLGPVCRRCAAVDLTGSTVLERTQKRRHITAQWS